MAYFKVQEQHDALKWQHLISAIIGSPNLLAADLDYLQTLDFNDPED